MPCYVQALFKYKQANACYREKTIRQLYVRRCEQDHKMSSSVMACREKRKNNYQRR